MKFPVAPESMSAEVSTVFVTFSFLFAPQPPSSLPCRSSVALVTSPLTPKDSSAPYRPCLILAPASS